MKKSIFKRKRFWGMFIVVIFFLYIAAASQLHWFKNQYFGEVIEISSSQIVIQDRREREFTVFLQENTRIIGNKIADNEIAVGDIISVQSSQILDTQNLQADFIRIMKPRDE
ncbi:hypothetical protein N9J72_01135 [Candidatus Gracilibacteria bacterium]|nr:hypothetical protein [Candidatus Gracilibacteria bacterium]